MRPNSIEIKQTISDAVAECRNIVDTCKKELRELTEEETARIEELKQLIAQKKEELEQLKKELDEIELPTDEVEQTDDNGENEQKNNENERKMKKQNFSLVKAIRSVANKQQLDALDKAVLEAGAEEFRKAGLKCTGDIQLPLENRAAITVATEGEDVVATDVFDVMTPLRANLVFTKCGARFIPNLVGDVKVPVMSAAQCAWAGETAAAADAAAALTHVKLAPKRLTCYLDLSKEFLAQDGVGVEQDLRQNLINAIQDKLEKTILGEGAGSGDEPAGMFNGAEVATVKTFKDITDLEAKIEEANINDGCQYIVSPKAKAALRNMTTGGKTTALVYENDEVAGTPALITTNVPANKMIYGDWKNLIIGSWGGGIDLTVDPYSQAGNGVIRLVINAYFDAAVARKEAFVFGDVAGV